MGKPRVIGSVGLLHVAVSIDNGPWSDGCKLHITHDFIDVTGYTARPNPAWTLVDGRNHFHAYTDDGTLPTLRARSEPVPCDGACGSLCEGTTRTVYECMICDEAVEPAVISGITHQSVPGRRSWSLEINDPVMPFGDMVSVQVKTDGQLRFGVGQIVEWRSFSMGELQTVIVQGIGELGWRALPARAAESRRAT